MTAEPTIRKVRLLRTISHHDPRALPKIQVYPKDHILEAKMVMTHWHLFDTGRCSMGEFIIGEDFELIDD